MNDFTVDELRVIMRALNLFSRQDVDDKDIELADELFIKVDNIRDELIMKGGYTDD